MADARIPARLVCPGCRKPVTGTPIKDLDGGGYRMRAHNRPMTSIEFPGQTCTADPIVRGSRIEYANDREPPRGARPVPELVAEARQILADVAEDAEEIPVEVPGAAVTAALAALAEARRPRTLDEERQGPWADRETRERHAVARLLAEVRAQALADAVHVVRPANEDAVDPEYLAAWRDLRELAEAAGADV